MLLEDQQEEYARIWKATIIISSCIQSFWAN